MVRMYLFIIVFLSLSTGSSGICSGDSGVQILLAGDSTMAAKRADRRPETGWGEMLQAWFDEADVVVHNHAMNGRSTRTFIEEGRWEALLDQVRPGDYVFIQFGHNDQSVEKVERYTPPDQYQANLARFVGDVRARQGHPVLLTPVVRRRFDETGNFFDSHGIYPDLVRSVARDTQTPLIDMEQSSRSVLVEWGAEKSKDLFLWLAPGAFENYPEGLQDNTHFSPQGARIMASVVAADIGEINIDLAAAIRSAGGVAHSPADTQSANAQ